MAPPRGQPPAATPSSPRGFTPSSRGQHDPQVAASNSTLKAFIGGRQRSWMANTAPVQPTPRPHYQAPKPPCPPGVRPATNQGGLTHPANAEPQPSQDRQPVALRSTQPSLPPAQHQAQPPAARPQARPQRPFLLPPASLEPSARLSVATSVPPSPAPSEAPSPAVSTTHEAVSPQRVGNPYSVGANEALPQPSARATASGTALPRPPSRAALANGPVGAKGGRVSHPLSTPVMALPATTAAMSLQTPPTPNNAVFSQGPPAPSLPASDVAQEHPAKRRRLGDALLPRATKVLDEYLRNAGGDNALAAVELPRFQLLRQACVKGDMFFVALHQMFCFRSAKPQEFDMCYARFQTNPTMLDEAFGLLNTILKSNSYIRQRHLDWLSQFPMPLPGVCPDPEYAAIIKNVYQFLVCLVRYWTVSGDSHVRQGYPYLVDELLLQYQMSPETLGPIFFRASRRMMGVRDGDLGDQMDQLFLNDLKRHRIAANGRLVATPNYLSDPTNIGLIRTYQSIVAQAQSQRPSSSYTAVPTASSSPQGQQQQPLLQHSSSYHQQPSTYQQQNSQQQLFPTFYHEPPSSGRQQHMIMLQQAARQQQLAEQQRFAQQSPYGQQQQPAYQQPLQAQPARQKSAVSTLPRFGAQFSTGAPPRANGTNTSPPANTAACVAFTVPSNGVISPVENQAGRFALPPPYQMPSNGNGQTTYASPSQSPTVSQGQSFPAQQAQGFRQQGQNTLQQFQQNPASRCSSLQSRAVGLSQSPQIQRLAVTSPRTPNGGMPLINNANANILDQQQSPPQGYSSPVYPPQQRAPPADLSATMATSPPSYMQPNRHMAAAGHSSMAQQQPGQPFVFTGARAGAGAGTNSQVRPSNVGTRPAAERRVHSNGTAAGLPGHRLSIPRIIPEIDLANYPHDPYERKSLMSSLHQVDVRSPPRQLRQTASRTAERHYQYVKYLALGPLAIPPQQALYNFSFNLPEEVCALISETEHPAEGLPVTMFSDRSLRIRLRCVFRPNAPARISESDWATADTRWPEHVFLKLNDSTLTVRRKQHHSKDLPIEIGSHVRSGGNALQLFVSDSQGKASRHLVPLLAVEVVETLSHSSVLGLPNLGADSVIPAADTVAIIKRRLGGTCGNADDDEIAMVVSDLTINLADPFSFRIFDVPVRGKNCTHLECFDLATWLATRPGKQSCTCDRKRPNCDICPKEPSFVDKWKCPLCSGDGRPQSLRIDGFLQEVRDALKSQEKLRTKEISVSADGSWRPRFDPADDQSDEDSDADAMPAGARSRSATKPNEQRAPAIIELD